MDIDAALAKIRDLKITNREIGHRIGISEDKVSKSIKGKRRWQADELASLASFLGMDREPEKVPVRMLPIIGLVAAGNWKEAIHTPMGSVYCPDPDLRRNVFVVRVDGNSMDKVVPNGTRLVVDPDDKQLITRKYYVIMNGDGETTFKQFLPDPARFVPVSNDDTHQPIVVGENHFEIVGRVVMNASMM